ncbi:hypothetical protein PDENDC454_14617 [Paenibacillus dendritiformis C454]|uniref:Uncharacterized protein n=1 Tax=Paenibacillus dendritiformis C454 TaxID=1131935 RepID=H3SHB0_9BACL|nr:hypothetical protein PDENDC454_14617 [Paenibacillus dendritiformis C454]
MSVSNVPATSGMERYSLSISIVHHCQLLAIQCFGMEQPFNQVAQDRIHAHIYFRTSDLGKSSASIRFLPFYFFDGDFL